MSVNHSKPVSLSYGASGRFSCDIDRERLLAWHSGPKSNARLRDLIKSALRQSLDFPPLQQAVVPGDRIVIALDRQTPQAKTIVSEVWKVLEERSIQPENVHIIQPASLIASRSPDPRGLLPVAVRKLVSWSIHDPTDETGRSYLTTTSTGERVYLASEVVNADFVLPIGPIAFDAVLGYRGTGSVLYPGLATPEDFARSHGQGHRELGPDDERPLRQKIDEIVWMLGVQIAIQVIAGENSGVSAVLTGAVDSVFRCGKQLLNERWLIELDTRPEIVVAAIDCESAGHGWEQLGAALATARNLVAPDGKIIILSGLNAKIGHGMQLIRESESPRDAIKPLRLHSPPDLICATQLATAADWANIYLLSDFDCDVIEDLFIVPLANTREVQRLLDGDETCVLLAGAQHTYGQIRSV